MHNSAAGYAGRLPRILDVLANSRKGSGESGKSTIVKQMKIIHQNGYTVDELALYRLTIYKNLIDCAKALIGAMRQFGIEPANPVNVEFSDYLLDYQVDPDPHTPLNTKVGIAVQSIWKDGSIESLMERQSEFYLMDSAP
jgi:guanine nucleotide-binding protein G(i) subunit alpha